MKSWNQIKNKVENDPLNALWVVAFVVFGICFWLYVGCNYCEIDNPNWHNHKEKVEARERRKQEERPLNKGYLGASFQCECGYSPAIAHPSYKDCIEYYERKMRECGCE